MLATGTAEAAIGALAVGKPGERLLNRSLLSGGDLIATELIGMSGNTGGIGLWRGVGGMGSCEPGETEESHEES